jgi:hypothetical protein
MAKRPFHKRSGVWFVLVLLGVLAALWWGLGFAEQNRQAEEDEEDTTDVSGILDERGELPADTEGPDGGEEAIGEAPSDFRQEVIAATLARASAVLPDAGSAGSVQRFWFFSDREVYVEYAALGSGTVNRMALLAVTGDSPNVALARTAFYGQGESGIWELIEGDDVLTRKPPRDLYERNPSGTGWIARN